MNIHSRIRQAVWTLPILAALAAPLPSCFSPGQRQTGILATTSAPAAPWSEPAPLEARSRIAATHGSDSHDAHLGHGAMPSTAPASAPASAPTSQPTSAPKSDSDSADAHGEHDKDDEHDEHDGHDKDDEHDGHGDDTEPQHGDHHP